MDLTGKQVLVAGLGKSGIAAGAKENGLYGLPV